jgi:hypothetical protein
MAGLLYRQLEFAKACLDSGSQKGLVLRIPLAKVSIRILGKSSLSLARRLSLQLSR